MKSKALSKIFCLIISLLCILASCGKRPSNVLSEDKMVDLMVDMELAEAYTNTGRMSNNNDKIELGKRVMKAHGVSEETLDTTLAWYGRNLDEYSALFEKVDKEILKRKKKYIETGDKNKENLEDLWLYGSHLVMNSLSGSDAFSFSFPNPDVKSGEVLEFSFALPNPKSIKTTLGVEYSDGTGEGLVSNFSNKKSIHISLSTDTAKKVKRIFGTLSLKEKNNRIFYIDSLKLLAEPFDSLTYKSNRRSQKHFGAMVKLPPPPVEKKDTIKIESDSTLVIKDSLPESNLRQTHSLKN